MTQDITPELERAVALYLVDEFDDLETARLNIDRVRKFMTEGQTAEHDGDCTNQCHTCLRCLTENFINKGRLYAALTASGRTDGTVPYSDDHLGIDKPLRDSGTVSDDLRVAATALAETLKSMKASRALTKARWNTRPSLESEVTALTTSPDTREALLGVVDAMRDWIVPDGISGDEFAERVVALLDNPKINSIIRELENGRS